jgi:hypothetical protein
MTPELLLTLDQLHCVASTARQLFSLSGRRGQLHCFARVLRRRLKSSHYALIGFAHREFAASSHQEYRATPRSHAFATTAHRRLTPRSSGAPTAGHRAPAGGTRYIFTGRRAVACRCRPLSSNVRQHMHRFHEVAISRNSGGAQRAKLPLLWFCLATRHNPSRGGTRKLAALVARRLHTRDSQARRFAAAGAAEAEYRHRSLLRQRRGEFGGVRAANAKCPRATPEVQPNSSVKRSANGLPPVPGRLWVRENLSRPGPGGKPSSPAYLER